MTRTFSIKRLATVMAGLLITASVAQADLIVALRFADDGSTSKEAVVNTTYTVNVYAQVTGQITTDINDYDPMAFEALQFLYFNVVSSGTSGGITGDVQLKTTAPASTYTPILTPTFKVGGYQTGVVQDINSDGMKDWGSRTVLTDMVKPRAAGATWDEDYWGEPQIYGQKIANGYEFLVGTFKVKVTNLGSGQTLSFVPEIPNTVAIGSVPAAGWWEDSDGAEQGATGYKNGYDLGGIISAGTSISLTGGVVVVTPQIFSVTADNTNSLIAWGAPAILDVDGSNKLFVGWGSQVTGVNPNPGAGMPSVGFAKFLAGEQSVGGNVQMAWRTRLVNEMATGLPLVSDVLKLDGMTAGDVYVLQMEYDVLDESIDGLVNEAELIAKGRIYMVTRPDHLSEWTKVGGIFVDGPYNGSLTPGTWGIDRSNPDHHYVWAVLNHASEFAIVPEPATMAFLLLGGMAMAGAGVVQRRRRGSR